LYCVKERVPIDDSADFVIMTASSLPYINPMATAETKSTSTSNIGRSNRANHSKECAPHVDIFH